MSRPNRLYVSPKGKYYYLIKGKKRYIEVPAGISQKQIVKVNIGTIPKLTRKRRVKKRRTKPVAFADTTTLLGDISKLREIHAPYFPSPREKGVPKMPIYLYQVGKAFRSINEVVNREQEANSNIERRYINNDVNIRIPRPERTRQVQVDSTINVETQTETPKREASTPPSTPAPAFSRKKESSTQTRKPTQFTPAPITPRASRISSISSLEELIREINSSVSRGQPYQFRNPAIPRVSTSVPFNLERRGERGTRLFTTPVEEEKISPERESKDDFPSPPETRSDAPPKTGERERQTGSGNIEGMYNDEIIKFLKKKTKHLIPVIPSDKTNDLLSMVKPYQDKFAFVINTAPSQSDGSGQDGYKSGHWRACFFNNEDDYMSAEYFDPLAEGKPPKPLLDIMKKIARKMNPEKMFLYKQNNLRIQDNDTSTCGWFACKFIDDRYSGVPWEDATGYTDYIDKMKPVDIKESEINKYYKKYKSYI